jgi:hypothetical protein
MKNVEARCPGVDVIHVDLSPTNFSKKLVELQKRFDQREIHCFINSCYGAWDEPSCGASVVDLLQNKHNVPFTGAALDFFEPTRLQIRQACWALVPS